MFGWIKCSFVNFLACLFFCAILDFKYGNTQLLLMVVIVLISIADVIFINGVKFGKKAYLCLIVNRTISVLFVFNISMTVLEWFCWFGFGIYCLEMISVISNQVDIIGDDIYIEEMEDDYKRAMCELDNLLSDEQKKVLNKLEHLVDEDKMCLFITNFSAKEIQKLLKVEILGIAFLIQKEDYNSISEMIERM